GRNFSDERGSWVLATQTVGLARGFVVPPEVAEGTHPRSATGIEQLARRDRDVERIELRERGSWIAATQRLSRGLEPLDLVGEIVGHARARRGLAGRRRGVRRHRGRRRGIGRD